MLNRFIVILLSAVFIFGCGDSQAASKADNISFLLSQVRASGVALSGGKVYFYVAGSSATLKTVWEDRNKATAAANPYTLDANGTAQLYGDGLYHIIIKDSAGVTKYDRDYINIVDYLTSGQYQAIDADYASLNAAISAIGSTPTTLTIKTAAFPVTGSVSIPSTMQLNFVFPGYLAASTYTITGLQEGQPENFGAVGDGATDDRAAIQALFRSAAVSPNIQMTFTKSYYLGSGDETYAQLELGSPTQNGAGVTNATIIGYGATLIQGAAGKAFAIYNANGLNIKGLKIIGYTGGTLDSTRERDSLITVNYNSKDVTIDGVYLTNSLGDCIYAGGSFGTGGETGYQTERLKVINSTLKTRYGNGVSSFTGGTMSRSAMALIDVVGAEISENRIYGRLALEPNLSNQHEVDIKIHDNQFLPGNVTAQSVIGTDYNHDEPVNTTGGTVIPSNNYMAGIAASPIVRGCTFDDNSIYDGSVSFYNVYKFDSVSRNNFQYGQIVVGSTSGSNNTTLFVVKDNKTINPQTGETSFIELAGNCTFGTIAGNSGYISSGYVVADLGASTGDNGRNVIGNNTNLASDATGSINITSVKATSAYYGNVALNTAYAWLYQSALSPTNLWQPLVTIPITGTVTLNWATYGGNMWYLSQGVTEDTILTDITNEPGDGFELTILCGASGSNTLSIVYDIDKMRLKGAVDAIVPNSGVITLINRAGIWFEKSRNF